MRTSQLLLVALSLSSGGWSQSTGGASVPQAPASSPAVQPATSPAVPPSASSAAAPPASANTPSVAVPPSGSSVRPLLPETSAAVSSSAAAPSGPASSPQLSAAPIPPVGSSTRSQTTNAAQQPSGLTTQRPEPQPVPPASTDEHTASVAPNTEKSNTPQESSALAVPGSARGGTSSALGSIASAPATGTGAAPGLSQPSADSGNGTQSRGGRFTSTGLAADVATASPSSPGLATKASFAALPSDGFRTLNEAAVKRMPESKEPTPPDVPTIVQFRAELNANIPEKPLLEKTAKSLAVMETAYFEYFVQNDPAPVDVGKISIPESISQCQNTYARRLARREGLTDKVLGWVPLLSRDLRGFGNCKAVESLEVGVYFHYMRASTTSDKPNNLEARVKAQVDALNEALGAVRINFRYMSLNWWEPKENEDWSIVLRKEGKLTDWQQRTRAPGKLTLTVWMVDALRGSDNGDLNSFATFPNDDLDPNDGIVIEAEHVQGGDSTTLIHDVGHWLGLGHTFGEIGAQCVLQDGLTNATQTSGLREAVYECSQVPCIGGNAVEINNYMSYSSCRGKVPQDGFTTDQKARMFANAIQFRRGYETGECMPDGKAAVQKRSSMQDLLDGKCPDPEKQASILMNTPHSLGSGTSGLSGKRWAGIAAFGVGVVLLA